jgi:hypothetical protein
MLVEMDDENTKQNNKNNKNVNSSNIILKGT